MDYFWGTSLSIILILRSKPIYPIVSVTVPLGCNDPYRLIFPFVLKTHQNLKLPVAVLDLNLSSHFRTTYKELRLCRKFVAR